MFQEVAAVFAALLLIPLSIALWRIYTGYSIYCRAVKAYGTDKVIFINRAFEMFISMFKKQPDSLTLFTQELRHRPDIKLMVVSLMQTVYILACDPEIIHNLTTQFSKNTNKWTLMIFQKELEKGLLFSGGEHWKKSRSVISNLFHFSMLKSREQTMYDVVGREINQLDKKEVDLFKLGCKMAGQIVIESLFGKEFTHIKIGDRTPLEETQAIILQLNTESLKPLHLLRSMLFGRVGIDSKYLTTKQENLKKRLLNIKRIGADYIQGQRIKKEKGEAISPFIDAYLNLNDESYIDEVIQQLVLFVIAGQDTTGELIEMCLYSLAQYPEYQEKVLNSLQREDLNIHTNKMLNNIIQQTNRLFGPVKFSLVRTVEEPFKIDSFEFAKGDTIRFGFGLCMTNIKYFDEPDKFIPQRFDKPLENPLAFTPFSGGPHNCIGQHMAMMEVRVAVSEILKKYKLERTEVPLKMVVRPVITTPAKHHLVKFITR